MHQRNREMITRLLRELLGKMMVINESNEIEIPAEIGEARKKLYHVMKKAKNEGNTVKLIKNKLFINGQCYRGSSTNGEEMSY